jgi:hypothetical protein
MIFGNLLFGSILCNSNLSFIDLSFLANRRFYRHKQLFGKTYDIAFQFLKFDHNKLFCKKLRVI